MNVLVIGASGLFGRKTAARLLQDRDVDSVVSMDTLPPPEWFMKSIDKYKDRFRYVHGDVSQLEDTLNAIKVYKIDRMVNWAYLMYVANINPLVVTKINALGMCNSFEAARLMGVNRVIYASSETVYGRQEKYGDRDVIEDDQLYPSHSYAITKRYAEILADQYTKQYGMSFTGVRPAEGYGHRSRWTTQYWPDMPSFAAVGKTFAMEGDGSDLKSLVAADDVAEFTLRAIKAASSPHPVYNLGGAPSTPRDLVKVVRKYIPDAKVEFGTQKIQTGLPWRVSTERSMADFGFSCMPVEEAVLIHITDARLEANMPPITAGG